MAVGMSRLALSEIECVILTEAICLCMEGKGGRSLLVILSSEGLLAWRQHKPKRDMDKLGIHLYLSLCDVGRLSGPRRFTSPQSLFLSVSSSCF